MQWVVFLVLRLIPAITMYEQSDYKGVYERLEVAYYNKDYVGQAKTLNFKYNRTQALTNFTFAFNYDYGTEVQVQIQAYRFASNEYRLFPIQLTFNLCQALKKNDFGIQDYYKCGNMTKCPLVKGVNFICNYVPTFSAFPPHIPQGRYQLDLKYIYHSIVLMHLQGYAAIEKIEKLRFA